MALLNYSTNVPAEQSAMEIQKMLAKGGAKAIMQEYDDAGDIAAISFQLQLKDGTLAGFKLPTDWRPVLATLKAQFAAGKLKHWTSASKITEAQAYRTAWRITKDWIEAQLAYIETTMVEPDQVFLPYLLSQGGKTVYEHFKDDSRFLLGGGGQ